jgi:hypothetical protein
MTRDANARSADCTPIRLARTAHFYDISIVRGFLGLPT